KRGGMVGNIYSMGLVMQALEVTEKFYEPREWDCAQAFSVVLNHDYSQPMAIAQVLPALVDKPYLKAGAQDCATVPATITVHYTISNKLQGKPFHFHTSVEVPAGSTLLRVLQVAEEKEPKTF
ncbi:IF factor, partial [Chloroceryle aenea]|nr:IF factor [Chloroceryle aenea]